MATCSSSSIVSGILVPAPLSRRAKDLGFSLLLCNSVNSLRLNNHALNNSYRCASQPRLSRKRLFRVQATILQDDEEKVVVEKSFDPRSFPEKDGEGTSGGSPDDSQPSTGLEKWIIKFEQSVNVLLTDSVIKILDTLYRDRHYPRFYVLETIARVPYFEAMPLFLV